MLLEGPATCSKRRVVYRAPYRIQDFANELVPIASPLRTNHARSKRARLSVMQKANVAIAAESSREGYNSIAVNITHLWRFFLPVLFRILQDT